MVILPLVCVCVVAFFLGSVPWGVIISNLVFNKDIRDEGSGNIGTTNAMRSLGKAGGAAVFVLDFGKGLASGTIGYLVADVIAPGDTSLSHVFTAAVFLASVLGHIFSPWLHFHGGKGIAVSVGALFFTFGPLGACLELAVFVIVVAISRYVSAGSVASAIACPFFALVFCGGSWPAIICCTITALVVIWSHRGNLSRLASGTERRIGAKKVDEKGGQS